MEEQLIRWVDAYSPQLLRWAYGKTGSREGAEELTQETWLQFLSAVRREEQQGRTIESPENLLWKVARHVWLRTLRRMTVHRTQPLDEGHPDPADFAADLAQRQEDAHLTALLHRRIVNLNRLQREAMILYYIEQVPQKEIARRLGVSEATLRWHLFDTRNRLREGVTHMTQTLQHVYRPHTLNIGINGQAVPDLATKRVNGSLLMQNILCACYQQGRTMQELAEMLGVARPYVEHDAEWLLSQELLREEKGRYYTTFMITTSQQETAMMQVFLRHKKALCDVIVSHLLAREESIRSIGFTGCDRPMSKLLWWLIYMFTRTLPLPTETPEPPIRPDGGKYWPRGFDHTEPVDPLRCDFAYNGSMSNDGFYWFGLHDFGQSEIEDMMDAWTPEYRALRTLLEKLIHADFDAACVLAEEQYILAQLVEKDFITMQKGRITPNFAILTQAQYDRLRREVFGPLAEALQIEIAALAEELLSVSRSILPSHLSHLAQLSQAMALLDVGYTTELLAFRDGTLYHPSSKRDGEFLTLLYVKNGD